MRLLILMIIATSILASSCTIQKRTFRNGYYVSWNKSVKRDKAKSKDDAAIKTEQIAESSVAADTIRSTEPNEELSSLYEKPDTLQIKEQVHADDLAVKNPTVQYAERVFAERLNDEVKDVNKKKDLETEAEKFEKKPNLFAINSLVFAIGYVILSFITIYTSLFALAIISFLLALFLAIVAIIKWKRKKGDYWGTFFAVMALGLLVLGTLILLLFILAGSL